MTEYWDGTGVTIETLEAEVRRLAEERPDYVYDPDNFPYEPGMSARCKYTHTRNAGDKVPGCIMGVAIHNLTGKLVDQYNNQGSVLDFEFMRDQWADGDQGWSQQARFLANVQAQQDQGTSWGQAVTLAALRHGDNPYTLD